MCFLLASQLQIMKRTSSLITLLLLSVQVIFGTNYKTINSGKWGDEAVWSPSGIPTGDDSVLISHEIEVEDYTQTVEGILFISATGKLDILTDLIISRQLVNNGILTSPLMGIKADAGYTSSGITKISTRTIIEGKYNNTCEAQDEHYDIEIRDDGIFNHAGIVLVNNKFVMKGIWNGQLGYLKVGQTFDVTGAVNDASIVCHSSAPSTDAKFDDFIFSCAVKYTIADGIFESPTVWDNGTSPTSANLLLIRNDVSINNNYEIIAGNALIINNCGKLSTENSNNALISNKGLFVNIGTITGEVSFTGEASSISKNLGYMEIDSLVINDATFDNEEEMLIKKDFTNTGTLINRKNLSTGNFTNGKTGDRIDTLINTVCAQIIVTGNFINNDYLLNNGYIEINDDGNNNGNFTNENIIQGISGYIQAENQLTNTNSLLGLLTTTQRVCSVNNLLNLGGLLWQNSCGSPNQRATIDIAPFPNRKLCPPFVISPDIDGPSVSYFWEETGSNETSLVVTESGTYNLTVTTDDQCETFASFDIIFTPNEFRTVDTVLCSSDSLKINNKYIRTSGKYTDTTLSTSTNFCRLITTYNVSISQTPDPEFKATGDGCAKQTLEAVDITNLSRWSTNELTKSIEITISQNITHYIKNENGCTDSLTKLIQVLVVPDLSFQIGDTSVCDSILLKPLLDGNGSNQLTWNVANTNPSELNVTQSGKFVVNHKAANSCTVTDTIDVIIIKTPQINLSNTYDECEPLDLSQDQPGTFVWTDLDEGISIGSKQTITLGETSLYSLEINNQGCTTTHTFEVTIHPSPELITTETTVCGNSTLLLEAQNADDYTWSTTSSSALIEDAFAPSTEVTISETTTVQLVMSNSLCGSQTETLQIDFVEKPALIVSPSVDSIAAGETVVLQASGASNYSWSPSATLSDATQSETEARPLTTTTYTVTGFNGPNCSESVDITIFVNDEFEVFIPNTFTPNDDGTNDVLFVRQNGLESLQFVVFNKWGNKIFETNSDETGWDGTYNSTDQPTDTYIYELIATTAAGTEVKKSGEFQLVR